MRKLLYALITMGNKSFGKKIPSWVLVLSFLALCMGSVESRFGALPGPGFGTRASAQQSPALAIDSFLSETWINPFTSSSSNSSPDLDRFVQVLAKDVAQTFSVVVEMENQIIQSEIALRSAGFETPSDFLKAAAKLADQLPEQVKNEIQRSVSPHELAERVLSGEAPFNGPESDALRQLLLGAKSHLQDHFQEKRIAHTKAYFRLALGLGALNAFDLALEIQRSGKALDEATRAKYEKLFSRLEQSAKSYLQNEALYEGPKRNMAVTPHNDFLRTAKRISGLVDFLSEAESTSGELQKNPKVSRETRTFSQALLIYLKRFTIAIVSAPVIAYHASKVILSIARDRTYDPNSTEVAKHGNLTASNSVMAITRRMGPIMGLNVQHEGLEHLEALKPDAVTMLTPTHRHALRDMIAVASLRFKNMALYANAGQIMNMIFGRKDNWRILGREFDMLAFKRKVVGLVNRNPSVLVAGPTHNPDREDPNFKPVAKSVRLQSQGIRTFLNYPHGALPSELGVDLPIVESWFGPKATLAESWRGGTAPNLVIVTLPNNVDPLGLGLVPEYKEGKVKVRVDGVVPGNLIKTLTAFGGESVLRHLFEANSNLGMVTNEHLHRGHIRTAALPEMMDRYMRRSSRLNVRACEATLVPVD